MIIQYFVNKNSGTSADTLLAIGVASFLANLCLLQHGTYEGITLKDCGPYYAISLPFSIDIETFSDEQLTSLWIVLPLNSGRQREKQAKKGNQSSIDGFDYDGEIERSRSYREQLKKLGPGLQTPEARLRKAPELQLLNPPDTRLGQYQAINNMKIGGSFNELALRWDHFNPHQKRLHIALLLRLFQSPFNDLTAAIATWQKLAQEEGIKGDAMASALQIINPTTGKGANRAKADRITIGNQSSFWLLELFKFSGFMIGSAPLLVQESDNRKTYVIQPQYIQLTLLEEMMKQFRAVFWPTTAVKLDILASLRFAQVLVDHYENLFKQQDEENLLGIALPSEPVSLVSGFDATFYKYLGSAHATMNISTIGLPTWLPPLKSSPQVQAAKELLAAHIELVRLLRNHKGEEGSEEYELLHLYRDFLSGNDLSAFWKFTTKYSSYLMSNSSARKFTIQELENLIMYNQREGVKLTPILENDGFKHIANAIRQSTISLQYRRAKFGDRTYDIRYGLGQDLKRKAHRPEEFMEALGLFLQQYSEETAREEEKAANRPKADRDANKLRSNISERDIADIVELIDQHGSGLICSMLIACGYALPSPAKEKD